MHCNAPVAKEKMAWRSESLRLSTYYVSRRRVCVCVWGKRTLKVQLNGADLTFVGHSSQNLNGCNWFWILASCGLLFNESEVQFQWNEQKSVVTFLSVDIMTQTPFSRQWRFKLKVMAKHFICSLTVIFLCIVSIDDTRTRINHCFIRIRRNYVIFSSLIAHQVQKWQWR